MALELLLLCALIFIFIVSFCGLLQKIKQSYERERLIADRLARRRGERNSADSFSEVYMNSAYVPEARNSDNSGVFPAAPPPYTQNYLDAPPRYEDLMKTQDTEALTSVVSSNTSITEPPARPAVHSTPLPYTISS